MAYSIRLFIGNPLLTRPNLHGYTTPQCEAGLKCGLSHLVLHTQSLGFYQNPGSHLKWTHQANIDSGRYSEHLVAHS